jgi:UDP-N-acetylglucosamine transferase subunit ALG13
MIFVTVGTTDFDALVEHMDKLAPTLGEKVVAQIGSGRYEPRHLCEWFRLAPSLTPYYERAQVVVSHGGLGTVMEVLRRGGRLVGLSNPDRFDHHQEDLLSYLDEHGNLIWCRSLDGLAEAIERAGRQAIAPYVPPPCTIHEVIGEFLRSKCKDGN